MLKQKWTISTFIVFTILMLNACKDQPKVETEVPVSVTANVEAPDLPNYQIKGMDGNPLNLSSLKGKKVFVNLWASWCGPCRGEMPSIQALYDKVKNHNVAFVMLGLDENFDDAANYFKSHQLNMPLYQPLDALPNLLNVPSIPTTFIFDEKGKLIKKIEGGSDYDTDEYRALLQ